MRLHVLSDLHLERADFELPSVEADVLVLAGDTARGTAGVTWAREQSRRWGRPVLYLAGNHEFYGHRLPGLLDELRARAAGSAVHLLENDELVLGGVRFLGCTLWTDFEHAGAERREESMAVSARVVRDYRLVGSDVTGRPLTPQETLERHRASRSWLESRLHETFTGPTVVLTHHQPIVRGQPRSPLMQALAGAFATDLSSLMGGDRVALWIYGHIHRAADFDVGGTRVLSNPRGYPRERVAGFDPALVVSPGRGAAASSPSR